MAEGRKETVIVGEDKTVTFNSVRYSDGNRYIPREDLNAYIDAVGETGLTEGEYELLATIPGVEIKIFGKVRYVKDDFVTEEIPDLIYRLLERVRSAGPPKKDILDESGSFGTDMTGNQEGETE